ncbi:MAG: class I SAM-dependent methyltransferase [Thermoplasmata archaeon]|nr:class I SAM-dependent methyltransferase [Thermoplasmata archaeon]
MRKSKDDIIRTYDAIAENFDVTRYHPWPDTRKFSEHFSPGQLILDLGCGNGRDMRLFEEKGIGTVGLDFSGGQLSSVRKRAKGPVSLVMGDVVNLPFRSGFADGALLGAVLHHIPDAGERLGALKEAHRCLKPGGLCLAGVWAAEQPKFKDNLAQAKIEFQHDWEPGDIVLDWNMPDGRVFKRYYHLFTEKEFDRLIAGSGFEIFERWFSAENHYAILKKC